MQASMCSVEHSSIHTHKHTPSCVDGWGTRAQFGPDILGQYNTQLLSLITLAGTIKPHSAIAHASQGENLFSLLQRHLSPSWGHSPARLHQGLKKNNKKKTDRALTGFCSCCMKYTSTSHWWTMRAPHKTEHFSIGWDAKKRKHF